MAASALVPSPSPGSPWYWTGLDWAGPSRWESWASLQCHRPHPFFLWAPCLPPARPSDRAPFVFYSHPLALWFASSVAPAQSHSPGPPPLTPVFLPRGQVAGTPTRAQRPRGSAQGPLRNVGGGLAAARAPSPGISGALAVLLHCGGTTWGLGVIRAARGSRWVGDPGQQMQRSGWDFTGQGRAPGEQKPGTRPACFPVCTMGSWCGREAPPPWAGGCPTFPLENTEPGVTLSTSNTGPDISKPFQVAVPSEESRLSSSHCVLGFQAPWDQGAGALG